MSGNAASPPDRYLTLAGARALECSRCGHCCDSRRTDGYWAWGELPPDQFAGLNDGRPLIIPIERAGDGWRDRARREEDGGGLTATRFRCAAFAPRPDGTGDCSIHDRVRPTQCDEFPLGSPLMPIELAERGEFALETGALPNCTWYRVVIVSDDDPRAEASERR